MKETEDTGYTVTFHYFLHDIRFDFCIILFRAAFRIHPTIQHICTIILVVEFSGFNELIQTIFNYTVVWCACAPDTK